MYAPVVCVLHLAKSINYEPPHYAVFFSSLLSFFLPFGSKYFPQHLHSMIDPQHEMLFNIHGSVHRNNILIYIQQDATLHSLFYLETALHVSGGAITHHQERKQLYLQHLVFVTPADSNNGVTNTRCCRYSCLRS